jgi:hypothetical protein
LNGYQLFIALFGLLSLAVSAWAVWCVAKARLPYKPAWILGSLFGFIGFGIVWTQPDDLAILFGVQIPPVSVFQVVATGVVIVKVQFPIIALVALAKLNFGKSGDAADD